MNSLTITAHGVAVRLAPRQVAGVVVVPGQHPLVQAPRCREGRSWCRDRSQDAVSRSPVWHPGRPSPTLRCAMSTVTRPRGPLPRSRLLGARGCWCSASRWRLVFGVGRLLGGAPGAATTSPLGAARRGAAVGHAVHRDARPRPRRRSAGRAGSERPARTSDAARGADRPVPDDDVARRCPRWTAPPTPGSRGDRAEPDHERRRRPAPGEVSPDRVVRQARPRAATGSGRPRTARRAECASCAQQRARRAGDWRGHGRSDDVRRHHALGDRRAARASRRRRGPSAAGVLPRVRRGRARPAPELEADRAVASCGRGRSRPTIAPPR